MSRKYDPKEMFGREYFDGSLGKWGGYAPPGYWFYPCNFRKAELLKMRRPKSVLEVGCAAGYTLWLLEREGIPCVGMDVSEWALHQRANGIFVLWDATKTPWPFRDKQFDLVYSCAFLEHIPEEFLGDVIREMERVARRGLHAITFHHDPRDVDKTHQTIRPYSWWRERLPKSHEVWDKEAFERGTTKVPGPDGRLKLNLGSHIHMYYYGWVNVDVLPLEQFARQNGFLFKRFDVRYGLPFNDGSVDAIVAHHLVEHLTYEEALELFKECHRVMKKGAVLRISVPDPERLLALYKKGKLGIYDQLNEPCSRRRTQLAKLWELLAGGHKSAWDFETAKAYLEDAGFGKVVRSRFNHSLSEVIWKQAYDRYPTISLYVEAVKT